MLARALAVAVLAFALAGSGSAAAATSPCGKRLTLDWAADGSVDGAYPRACYVDALANVRTDLKLYSSFVEDIRAAMRRAESGGTPVSQTVTRASDDGDGGDSVPLPLVLLGGAAVVLVAGGAGGMAWKRLRKPPSDG